MPTYHIESNPINKQLMYRVYQIIDPAAVDHAGNRAYVTTFLKTEQEAQEAIDQLNNKS